MTEIDVPDWVVKAAEDARVHCLNAVTAYGSAGVDERYHMAMRAALTAALGAWVVLGPYRFLKNGDNPSDWLDRQINGEPPNPKHLREEFRIENAYTLRQEKPE